MEMSVQFLAPASLIMTEVSGTQWVGGFGRVGEEKTVSPADCLDFLGLHFSSKIRVIIDGATQGVTPLAVGPRSGYCFLFALSC
jgi:hypothetical protein